MAYSPDDDGYWLAGADGSVFTEGDASFHGSLIGMTLAAPIVGIAATSDGGGYWLVGADGGIFSFGDAPFLGSMASIHLASPVAGMVANGQLDNPGYILVATDGGAFTFGSAGFYGSMSGVALAAPIVGIATTADGNGNWLVGADGGVFTFGDAEFHGSGSMSTLSYEEVGCPSPPQPFVGLAPTADGKGYWLASHGFCVVSLGDAEYASCNAPNQFPPPGCWRSFPSVGIAFVTSTTYDNSTYDVFSIVSHDGNVQNFYALETSVPPS